MQRRGDLVLMTTFLMLVALVLRANDEFQKLRIFVPPLICTVLFVWVMKLLILCRIWGIAIGSHVGLGIWRQLGNVTSCPGDDCICRTKK